MRASLMSNILISIAGDSGAGKSSLLKFLSNLWDNDVLLVEGDAYHKWERNDTHWNDFTPLNPAANNIDQCYVDLLSLKNNKIISFKEYNHSTGKFDPPKDLMPKNRIIFTGLHALYDQRIRELSDVKIYLNTDEDLRLFWKYKRDIQERGYTKDAVTKSLECRIKDSKRYIRPQVHYADIIINVSDDDLIVNDFSYTPKLSISVLIDKQFMYIKNVMHILKNINFSIAEDERFIKAYYNEKVKRVQDIHI